MMKKKSQTTKVMAENNRKVNKKFLTQPDKDSVQVLLDDVEQRRFFVDITEDEYDALYNKKGHDEICGCI